MSKTLHGRDWTAYADTDRRAVFDDPEKTPQRDDHKAALRDASLILKAHPWRGHPAVADQPQAFPRTGIHLGSGFVASGIPEAIQKATAYLAAHLVKQADQPIQPELFASYTVGESSGTFRAPSLDSLPKHIRQLIAPFLTTGTTWAPVRP
ncbi:DnaT-like ssDNA-binding protein [Brevundimonas sp. VNH65]|uniref:DnaT-like ssDNA-binding protein n=1 Tax=Brevundimonas sp. VNH65 TaxID=3400917 RepID=UPI003C08BE40